jgi:hypothetical protein
VTHELEDELSDVERAVDDYLDTLSDSARGALLASLEQVDELCATSDAFRQRFSYPYIPRTPAVGATSLNPIIEEVPGSIFEAQVDVVKAAKQSLRELTSESLADLRSAVATLKQMRGPGD